VLPREPQPPSPPRAGAPLARSFDGPFLLLFGGIWAFVGTSLLLAFTLSGAPPWDDLLLDRRGVVATAAPVRSAARARRVNHRRVFAVTYRFRDAAGTVREGTLDVPDGRTGPFAIEYDPASPSRARLRGERASALGAGLIVPTAFAVIGWALFLQGRRARRRERALYRDGTAAAARVRAVAPTGGRVNREPAYRVEFMVPGPDGVVRASCVTLDPPREGDTVWVIYDPADPTRAMLA
jgi:hypothetical protein